MSESILQTKDEIFKKNYRLSVICKSIAGYAKAYIKENRKATTNIDVKIRDAVLVDAINYLAITKGFEFDLLTKHLYRNKKYPKKVEAKYLLEFIMDSYADYIFNENMVDSVLLNCYSNSCRKKFDINDGALVLVDFINYIASTNRINRIFTLKELYEKAKITKHIRELNELKIFLEHTGDYYNRMQKGENINLLYNVMADCNDLGFISRNDKYCYTEQVSKIYGQNEMFVWDKMIVEKEIYAMAYAYAKMYGSNQLPKIQIIKRKIIEMTKK